MSDSTNNRHANETSFLYSDKQIVQNTCPVVLKLGARKPAVLSYGDLTGLAVFLHVVSEAVVRQNSDEVAITTREVLCPLLPNSVSVVL